MKSIESESTIKQVSAGKFEGTFSTAPGEHNGQYTVKVSDDISFSENYSYHVFSSAKVEIEEQKFPLIKAKITINGKGKKDVDNAFIEIRHKQQTNVVYYKRLSSVLKGVYTFTKVELDQLKMLSGDYEATLVVVDDLLKSEHRTSLGTLS